MAYNLTGKAVQNLQLAAAGESLGVKVIMAKQNDANSRFIHAVIKDSRGNIDCSGASVQLNATLPDGLTHLTTYGEIINGEPYVLIPRDFLANEGKLSCDITLMGTFNQFDTSIGTSSGITTASVSEPTFIIKVAGKGGQYVFIYDGTNWKLGNDTVALNQYGITTTGAPTANDTIIITYSTAYILTTETFYIVVVSTNYDINAGIISPLGDNIALEVKWNIQVDDLSSNTLVLNRKNCYRIGSVSTNLTLDLADTDKALLDFESELIFTYVSGTFTYPDGNPTWSGTDVTNGVFVPQANKTYDILFYNISRNSTPNIQAIVRGV